MQWGASKQKPRAAARNLRSWGETEGTGTPNLLSPNSPGLYHLGAGTSPVGLVDAQLVLLHPYSSRAQTSSGRALGPSPEPWPEGRIFVSYPSRLVGGDQHACARGAAVDQPQ